MHIFEKEGYRMKNLKLKNVTVLLMTSCILVGCHSNNQSTSIYENKTIISTETEQVNREELIETQVTTEVDTQREEVTEEQISPEQITEEKMTDEEVLEYIDKIGDEMTNCSESITESAKQEFITLVDFIFYGGEIGGRTFDSLKDSTKTKVLEIYNKISDYIEKKWPTWRQTIIDQYNNIGDIWDENKDDISNEIENQKQKVKKWYENFREENKK